MYTHDHQEIASSIIVNVLRGDCHQRHKHNIHTRTIVCEARSFPFIDEVLSHHEEKSNEGSKSDKAHKQTSDNWQS